jgi:hypothetical protein
MTQVASPPSDAVSEVLRTFAVRSTIFRLSELREPWAFARHAGYATEVAFAKAFKRRFALSPAPTGTTLVTRRGSTPPRSTNCDC